MPVYNAQNTLERAINSLLVQAEIDQIILVDDGSTDSPSGKMLEGIEIMDNNGNVYARIGSWLAGENNASAFSNGEQDFALGLSINDNPYIEKFFDHESADKWLCGYLAARENQLNISPAPDLTPLFVDDCHVLK